MKKKHDRFYTDHGTQDTHFGEKWLIDARGLIIIYNNNKWTENRNPMSCLNTHCLTPLESSHTGTIKCIIKLNCNYICIEFIKRMFL